MLFGLQEEGISTSYVGGIMDILGGLVTYFYNAGQRNQYGVIGIM